MAARGPELQLGVALGLERNHEAVIIFVDGEARHYLRVTAIEPFGQPHDRSQQPDDGAMLARESPEPLV